MKTTKTLGLILLLLLQIFCIDAYSQCRGFIKKVDLSMLDDYDYCGEVMSASMYSTDSAEIMMKFQSKNKYRILVEAQKYLGEVQVEVTNSSNELISMEVVNGSHKFWEVYTTEKEKVEFKIKFRSSKEKSLGHGIQAAGCVVLAVGNLNLDELVSLPENSTDL